MKEGVYSDKINFRILFCENIVVNVVVNVVANVFVNVVVNIFVNVVVMGSLTVRPESRLLYNQSLCKFKYFKFPQNML